MIGFDEQTPGGTVDAAAETKGERRLVTTEAAGELAGVSESTIRRLIEQGRLKALNYGSALRPKWRIDTDDLWRVQDPTPTPAPVRRRHRMITPPVDLSQYRPRATVPA